MEYYTHLVVGSGNPLRGSVDFRGNSVYTDLWHKYDRLHASEAGTMTSDQVAGLLERADRQVEVRLKMPESLRVAFKVRAAQQRVTMVEAIRGHLNQKEN